MHSFQQELDPVTYEMKEAEHPVMRELMSDRETALTEEVRLLRQRIAVLEAALAAATAAQFEAAAQAAEAPASSEAPSSENVTATEDVPASEFSDPQAPAVAPVESDQGFAAAWSEETEAESSFEERLAEKAFFEVGVVDESSRNWLLTS